MTNRGETGRTGWRFLLAGGVNTLFGWLVYSLCMWLGAPVWLALLTSTVCGVGFNFLTMGGYVFRQLDARRLPRFVAAYVVVYAVNVVCVQALADLHWSPIWVQLGLAPLMAGLSFLLMSRWVFAGALPDAAVAHEP
jgi:putative flippase GtrA